jgi:hypothetical protein
MLAFDLEGHGSVAIGYGQADRSDRRAGGEEWGGEGRVARWKVGPRDQYVYASAQQRPGQMRSGRETVRE